MFPIEGQEDCQLPIRPLRMTSVAQAEARALGSGQLVQGLITGSR